MHPIELQNSKVYNVTALKVWLYFAFLPPDRCSVVNTELICKSNSCWVGSAALCTARCDWMMVIEGGCQYAACLHCEHEVWSKCLCSWAPVGVRQHDPNHLTWSLPVCVCFYLCLCVCACVYLVCVCICMHECVRACSCTHLCTGLSTPRPCCLLLFVLIC